MKLNVAFAFRPRRGGANYMVVMGIGSILILVGLLALLMRGPSNRPKGTQPGNTLFMYCAAGMRLPVETVADEYEAEYGVQVQLQFGGSNTLLSQIEVTKVGDLYLAADDSYTKLGKEKGFINEEISLASMRPVIIVAKGNPKNIEGISDLIRDGVRVALGNSDQAAIGKLVRRLLQETGQWTDLEPRVTVFKPTVNDVANDVKLGSVDAGIVWDSLAAQPQYSDIEAIRTPELDQGTSKITIGIITQSKKPTAALRFARYLAARDRGLKTFGSLGYEVVDGDVWAEVPQLTCFAGAVNRKALAPVIEAFAKREGLEINTVYNGCGILTAQMRAMLENDQASGFPDMYMACDVYYLDTVADLFQDAVNVSNTDIVIVVQKGNPKGIQGLADLAKPGVRVAIGQPDQCTIGYLSHRLLESEGLDEKVKENVVTETATSSLLVPNITTGSADAVLAYATDTLAERNRLDVIPIDSPLAKAIQPYSIAKSSDYKYLGRRLFQAITRSRGSFESAGFVWRLGESTSTPNVASKPESDSTQPGSH